MSTPLRPLAVHPRAWSDPTSFRRPGAGLSDDCAASPELVSQPFVGLQDPSALQRLYRDQAERLGATLRERVLVASFDGVRRLVGAGLGVSILPAAALAEPEAALVTRPLAEPWALRPLALCLRQTAGLSAAARLLVQHFTGQALPVAQG